MIFPFVAKPAPRGDIEKAHAVKLYNALNAVSGIVSKLDADHKILIDSVFSELHQPEAYKSGRYKVGGYVVDFSPWLRTYWVETKYSGIVEVKAFNRTLIRRLASTPSQIIKIVEILN